MAVDRHLWRLGVDGRLLAVYIEITEIGYIQYIEITFISRLPRRPIQFVKINPLNLSAQ